MEDFLFLVGLPIRMVENEMLFWIIALLAFGARMTSTHCEHTLDDGAAGDVGCACAVAFAV